MAEYLIQDATLIGLGDKVRAVTGTENAMSPAEMQSELDAFNADMEAVVTSQDELIAQIQIAIASKSAVTLPTLSNPASAYEIMAGYEAINSNGEVVMGTMTNAEEVHF